MIYEGETAGQSSTEDTRKLVQRFLKTMTTADSRLCFTYETNLTQKDTKEIGGKAHSRENSKTATHY